MKSFIKKYFVAGILVLAPIAVTVWVLQALILWCNDLFINFLPADWRSLKLFGYTVPGVGVLLTLGMVFLTGVLTQLYLGKQLIALGDRIIHKIPFGRGIYKSIKQMLNAVVTTGKGSFRQVVLVHFGDHSQVLGFVTGETEEALQQHLAKPCVNVFVPTSPNPTTGILFLISKENITPIDISAEKAFRFIVSGGTVRSQSV